MRFDRRGVPVKLIKDVTMVVRTVAPDVPAQIAGFGPAMRRHTDEQCSELNALARVGNQNRSNLRRHCHRPGISGLLQPSGQPSDARLLIFYFLSAASNSLAMSPAEAGFWPVMRRPSTTT